MQGPYRGIWLLGCALQPAMSLVLRSSAGASLVVVGAVGKWQGGDVGGQAEWQRGSSPLQKGCKAHHCLHFKGA